MRDFEGMVAWGTTRVMKDVRECLGLLFARVLWVGMGSAQIDFLLVLVSVMVERCFEGKKIKKVVTCLLLGRFFETPLGWAGSSKPPYLQNPSILVISKNRCLH